MGGEGERKEEGRGPKEVRRERKMEKREREERESLTCTQQRPSLILAGAVPKQTVDIGKPESPIWSGILSFPFRLLVVTLFICISRTWLKADTIILGDTSSRMLLERVALAFPGRERRFSHLCSNPAHSSHPPYSLFRLEAHFQSLQHLRLIQCPIWVAPLQSGTCRAS